jgi:hypothetical protein
MEMAGNPAFGTVQSVNCEFCGTPVLAGAKLCTACRSALKRARHEPSSVLSPLAKGGADTREGRKARKAAKAAKAAQAGDSSVIPPPVARRRSTTPALAGALLAAVCITGYAILQLSEHAPPAPPSLETFPSLAPPAAESAPAAPPAVAPATPAAVQAPVEVAAPPAPPAPHPRHVQRKLVLSPDSVPTRIAAPGAFTKALPPPVLPKPVAPPDRRTLLQQRFAACVNPEVLAQAFCEQRARIELCDGLWGSVPQCPAQRDYGS